MNQDSFRHLLEASRPSSTSFPALGAASTSRSRLVVQSRQKSNAGAVSKPAFKPRNVRKPDDAKDRDPQDKSSNADNNVNVEHAPLKGLDFALLQQERAKAGLLSTNDVDELEQAFAESSAVQNSEQVAPRKRTREDLVQELKQRRLAGIAQPSESIKPDVQLEEAKQKGKFKPIGFTSTSKRRKDGASNADGKKKKRKVNDKKSLESEVKPLAASMTATPPTKTTPNQHKPTTDEDFDDNFDIFADAGEYTGVEIDENEEAELASPHLTEVSPPLPQRWIVMDEPEHVPQTQIPIPIPEGAKTEADQEVEERPLRLAPLESSAIPSIKELLDMHDAADKHEKKLKRKAKNQRKRGGNLNGKGSDDE